MAVSRKATVKIGVDVDQKTADQFNKSLDRMVKSGGNVQTTFKRMSDQIKQFTNGSSDFTKDYKKTFDQINESNKQALKSNREFVKQTVNGNKNIQKSIDKLNSSEEKSTKSSSRNSQQHTRNMNSVARSYDHATSRIDRMSKAADKAMSVGRSMSLTTLGLGAAMVKGSNDAMKLQHQFNVIQNLAVYGGEKQASAQRNVNAMRKQGEKYSLQYGVSQEKLSNGYEELIRRGYQTNQALSSQKYFLQASIASGDDYNDVVHNSTAALESFNLRSNNNVQMMKNSKMATNQMAMAADLTATDFQNMGYALKFVGPAAHAANQSMAETTSTIGQLSNAGIDASTAGTSLRQILDRLVAPPKKGKAVNAMKQLGLTDQSFRDGKGNLLSLQDIFGKLNDHMKGMNSTNRGAIFNALFGQTAQSSATVLSEHVKGLKDLNKQVANAQNMHGGKGYIAELSAHNMKTAQSQVNKFKAALSDLNITFANEILPNITGLTKGLSNMIAKLADSPSWFKKLVAYGGVFVAGIAPVTLVFGAITKAVKGVATSLGWVRKQFQAPMSNTMTNSMVRQSEEMQLAGQNSSGGSALPNKESRMSRFGRETSSMERFKSRFGSTAKTGTRLGKVGQFTKDGELIGDATKGLSRVGKFSKVGKMAIFAGKGLGFAGAATSLLDMVGAKKSTMGNHVGKTAGSAIGTAAGGALGSLIPIPVVGTGLGAAAGGLAGEKIGGMIGKRSQNSINKKYSDPIASANKETDGMAGNIRNFNVNSQLMSSVGKKGKSSKQMYQYLHKQNKNALKGLQAQANKYAHDGTSNAYKDAGLLNKYLGKKDKVSGNKMAKTDKNNYQKRLSEANVAIRGLAKAETKGGKTRSNAIKKANKAIARLSTASGKKQQSIMAKMYASTGKMSDKEAGKLIAQSSKIKNAQIKNANATFKKKKASAKKQYNATITAAYRELKAGSINKKQYNEIISGAEKAKDKSISSAEKTKKSTIKSATDQKKKVVAQAKKQTKDHLASVDTETGKSLGFWGRWAKRFKGIFGGIGKWFSGLWKGITGTIGNIGKSIGSLGSSIGKKFKGTAIGKGAKSLWNTNSKIGKNNFNWVKEKASGIGRWLAGYAGGGPIRHSQRALVNEHGPESAWNPRKGTFRFLGNGRPMLTKLYAGEHVLTAKQTKQLAHGGMKGHFKAYAGGTGANLGNSASTIDFKVANPTALLKFSNQARNIWNRFRKNTKRNTEQMSNDTADGFTNMKKSATTKTTGLGNVVLNRVTNLRSGLNKLVKGLVSDFNSIFGKLPNYADNSMKGVTNSLNKGITGINSSLTQFGGNSHVLKPIHYAKGSNGKVPNNHLAMVNDAPTGPRQEAIVRNNKLLYPNGKNALVALQQGDQVLNGHQTQMIESMNNLAHYAKGSGVSNSALRDIANKNAKNPGQTWDNSFKFSNNGSQLQQGLTDESSRGAKQSGQSWTKAMWSLISNLANGGSGSKSAFLNYAMSHFSGKRYSLGASGPDAYDCSSMVGAALAHFGINIGRTTTAMQGSSQLERIGKNIGKTQPGDLALFGHGNGAAGHVGIVNNPNQGTIFNETPPAARTTPLSYITALPLDAFYRVKGLKNTIKSGGNKALNSLVKKQLGKRAMKWISNKLAPKFDAGGPAPTGDHAHWLKQAGIPGSWWSGLNEIITKESGWNPHAMNPSGAYGLGQALPGSKMASTGSDWKDNPITQLRWVKDYINGRYGGIEQALSFRHAHNWYANGGWANKPGIFGEVPGQPEVAINPKRPSADRLIGEAINARAKADTKSPFARLIESRNSKSERDSLVNKIHKFMNKKNTKSAQPNINLSVNITVNGNADEKDLDKLPPKLKKAVRDEFQQLAFNSNQALFGD